MYEVLVVLKGKRSDEADAKHSEAYGRCAKGHDYTTEIVVKQRHYEEKAVKSYAGVMLEYGRGVWLLSKHNA